jgi:hypothetical protein
MYLHLQLGGLVLLGRGIWVQVEKGDYVAIADSDTYTGLSGAILRIVVGAVTAVIAIVGLFGAFKRKSVLLWIVSSVYLALLLVQWSAMKEGLINQKQGRRKQWGRGSTLPTQYFMKGRDSFRPPKNLLDLKK